MKPSRFFVPSSESPLTKKLAKKILSTILATLAVSIATLDTAYDLPSFPVDGEAANSVRLGLSRQRPAFRKAVNMLAEAAPENERLADYYERVTKRVKGDGDDAENVAGAAIAVRRKHHRRSRTESAASVAHSQAASQGLVGVAQAAPLPEASSRNGSSSISDSQSGRGADAGSFGELTVGDVAFDTNAEIEYWMDYYTSSPIGRSTLKIGIERSNSYLEMARAEFRSAGVPEDLVWLAFVESVWNPRAVSPAAAGGLWQFIPSTATEYGLRVETGNDEREDPLKQTRVAAAYLRDLYTIFGDWSLAMAAYNSGEPRVMGAIVRNGNANFWELSAKQLLPKETCNYVPKILATIMIASRAEVYGLAPEAETPVYAGS